MNKKNITWIVLGLHSIYLFPIKKINAKKDINLFIVLNNGYSKGKLDETTKDFQAKYVEICPFFNIKIFSIYKKLKYFKGLNSALSETKSDVIISNLYCGIQSFQIYKFAQKRNIKLVLITEDKFRKKRRFSIFSFLFSCFWDITIGRKILDYADRILPWTNDSKKYMESIAKDKNKIMPISAGIDTNLFCLNRTKKYIPNNIVRLLMVARIHPVKDHYTLLRALKYLKNNSFLKFEISLLGNGENILKNKIKKQIEDYGLEGKVFFKDKVCYEDMAEIYNNHDVLILPSKSEAVGMVIPEAMACGLPVVVSDNVGAKDYVVKGENGLIFKTGDHIDLANKIKEISEMNIEEMGKSAANHIARNYNIEKTTDNFYEILKNL